MNLTMIAIMMNKAGRSRPKLNRLLKERTKSINTRKIDKTGPLAIVFAGPKVTAPVFRSPRNDFFRRKKFN